MREHRKEVPQKGRQAGKQSRTEQFGSLSAESLSPSSGATVVVVVVLVVVVVVFVVA